MDNNKISVKCPHCKDFFKIPQIRSSQNFKCPHCNKYHFRKSTTGYAPKGLKTTKIGIFKSKGLIQGCFEMGKRR